MVKIDNEELDLVISRRTESGDDYLERYRCSDVHQLKEMMYQAVDIGYTSEMKFIIIKNVHGYTFDEIEREIYSYIEEFGE